MKQEAFKRWLEAQGQAPASVSSRASGATRVERQLGDLEELFAREGREAVLGRFAYSSEDERQDRPNPSQVPIDGVLRTGLASIRQSLDLYHRFLSEPAAMPDKDLHLALIRRLARKEIDAAMRDCDQLGQDAFLARGGFARPKVWVMNAAETQTCPAKAIVAVALGNLPDGQALSSAAFFNGGGDTEAADTLEALGYQILRASDGALPNDNAVITRASIESAMDAFDRYRNHGDHDAVFSRFGEPSSYWVRSSRARENRVYPTKPLIGFILNKTELNGGGWGQKSDAAARLHNAGFIIVDKDDDPVTPAEGYGHLMTGADRIRLCALNYVIEPARERGASEVAVRAGDLAADMGLQNVFPNICSALGDAKFQQLARTPPPRHTEPHPSSSTIFTYTLGSQTEADAVTDAPKNPPRPTTNLILYGPPGTGKTWTTAYEAVRLCLGENEAARMRRDPVARMAAYRDLVRDGRVEFVTFHQSFSYEEFVEGLRPVTSAAEGVPEDGDTAGGFRLKPHEGVFKRISERARLDTGVVGNDAHLDRARSIFKVALGRREEQEDRILHGLDADLIHTGWGGDIDWSDARFDDFSEIRAEWRSKKDPGASGHDGNVVVAYALRAAMQQGDYVVVSDGRDRFRAFGRVTGEYFHDPAADFHPHRRRVEWIWRDDAGAPRSRFYGNGFRRHSVYKLNSEMIDWDALEEIVLGEDAAGSAAGARDYVLVIDEINRANISKVFGELITLLEPDKRLGAANEIRLRLPYSGKPFGVPANLHIIGTMNTADRSIALLDTALRRRFAFRELMPDPSRLGADVDGVDLQRLLAVFNDRIEYLFDREHRIGHAYFMGCRSRVDIDAVMRDNIIPLLAEYFYDDWAKIAAVLEGRPVGAESDLNGRFLCGSRLVPPGFESDDDEAGERLRWSVQDEFDFSEFAVR